MMDIIPGSYGHYPTEAGNVVSHRVLEMAAHFGRLGTRRELSTTRIEFTNTSFR